MGQFMTREFMIAALAAIAAAAVVFTLGFSFLGRGSALLARLAHSARGRCFLDAAVDRLRVAQLSTTR